MSFKSCCDFSKSNWKQPTGAARYIECLTLFEITHDSKLKAFFYFPTFLENWVQTICQGRQQTHCRRTITTSLFSACKQSKALTFYPSHCLGMNYHINFLGGIGSNGFEYSAPMTIETTWILGAILELPDKQHCQFGNMANLAQFWGT